MLNERSSDALYRGGILEEALNSLKQNPRLDALAVEFIDRAREAEAERKRLALEQEDRIRRLCRVARVAALAFIVAVVAGVITIILARDAQSQATTARESLDEVATQQVKLQNDAYSYRMVGQSELNLSNEDDALAFAFEAISVEQPPTDVQNIFYAIAANSHHRLTLRGHTGIVISVAFSPEGTTRRMELLPRSRI